MKFFYTNPDQDKLYLKVNTLINISYWIASDAFHFASKQVKEINKYEYNNLEVTNDNSKILKQEKNIFNDYELILEKGNVLSFKR